MADWKYAVTAGFVLLGIAAYVVFAIQPGSGLEDRIAWFMLLLPGAFAFFRTHTSLSSIIYWPFIFAVSFVWYFAMGLAAIKVWRLLSRCFNA